MKKIYNKYCYLSIVIHELSHLIIGLLMFRKPTDIIIKFNKRSGEPYGMVVFKNKNKIFITQILSSLAPLLFMIMYIILAFYFNFFIFVVIYQLSTFKFSIPSEGDILNIKEYRLYKRFRFDVDKVHNYRRSIGEDVDGEIERARIKEEEDNQEFFRLCEEYENEKRSL